MKKMLFADKVAIITGSNRGIGKRIAVELAKGGASVILNGRDNTRLQEAVRELKMIHDRVTGICCDITTPEGSKHLVEETYRIHGRIDILVNNAGISMRGNFADLDPVVFRTVFDVNVFGTSNVTIAAMKYLRMSHGSIVFISSLAGIRGLPGLSVYCASKMALRALAESIRIEEAEHKIHVGLILVGITENEKGKETISKDGSRIVLEPRTAYKVLSFKSVAKAVIKNISHRKNLTILTPIGKANAILQAICPGLNEWIIMKNRKKFEDRSR